MKPFEFLGPYRLHATIGRGGMGRVFRAENVQSGEPVAVKLIADNVADDPRFRRRFADEVETLKRLKHPNIVRLIGYGEEHGHLFYSMELVEGESLQEKLRREKRLAWAEVLDLAIDICRALKHAHDFGVIHRDLKPANLLIDRQGKLKIVDFGIAKLFGNSEQTVAGSVLGTADYMAPEQAGEGPITPRVDLYALGNVLYACFAGRPPFVHRSVTVLMESLRKDTPRRIEELNPEVPLEIAELIHDLLQKRPEDRPPTALAVMNRLMAIREGMKRTMAGEVRTPVSGPAAITPAVPANPTVPKLGPAKTSLTDDDNQTLGGLDVEGPTGRSPSLSDRMTVAMKPSLPSPAEDSLAPQRSDAADHAGPAVRPDATGRAGETGRPVPAATVGFAPSAAESLYSRAIVDLNPSGGATRAEPRTHFQTVQESERARGKFEAADHEADEPLGRIWQWLSLAGLIGVLLIGLVVILWSTRRPDSDDLYAAIEAANETDDVEQVQRLGDQFLRLYPSDPRAADINELRADVDIKRVISRLQATAKRAGGIDRMSAAEWAFLDAVADRNHDPETTRERLGQWLDLYDHPTAENQADPSPADAASETASTAAPRRPSLELLIPARKEFERLSVLPEAAIDPRAQELLERIRWAGQALEPEQRRRMLEAIVSLFTDKTWARPAVAEARRLLADSGG